MMIAFLMENFYKENKMTYVKFGPVGDFDAVNNINNKIHRFFGEFPNLGFEVNYPFKPKADFYGDDQSFLVELEVPGMKKEEIKISFKDNQLIINGDKKDYSKGKKTGEILKSERNFGNFSRSFQFPEEINPENIEATFEDGVLKVTIAKAVKKSAGEKEIKIK